VQKNDRLRDEAPARRRRFAYATDVSPDTFRRNGHHNERALKSTRGDVMTYRMHTSPVPDPLADPTRDPEGDPLTPPSPGHHNDEPQRPEGPPDKDPVVRAD
jgi:hypothetical protein